MIHSNGHDNASIDLAFTSEGQSKTIHLWVEDEAGNLSHVQRTITYDLTQPDTSGIQVISLIPDSYSISNNQGETGLQLKLALSNPTQELLFFQVNQGDSVGWSYWSPIFPESWQDPYQPMQYFFQNNLTSPINLSVIIRDRAGHEVLLPINFDRPLVVNHTPNAVDELTLASDFSITFNKPMQLSSLEWTGVDPCMAPVRPRPGSTHNNMTKQLTY